jgi:diguanylate cyclase (GGDEF)-like protein
VIDLLFVEDSSLLGKMLSARIEKELGYRVTWRRTYAEAEVVLNAAERHFSLALLDLTLPDALEGEVVDLVLSKGIPVVVFTAQINDELREQIWSKKIVDYVLKEGDGSVTYLLSILRRVLSNEKYKVLVVDDSKLALVHLLDLLNAQNFNVVLAKDGVEALDVLKRNSDISIVVTDYNMPNMDGIELTKKIREKYTKNEMVIIGISSYGNPLMAAKFIKCGANDYINKPLVTEEFYCRLNQNLELFECMRQLTESSIKDYLTGLYNRRYLYEAGAKLHANALRTKSPLAVAMVDVDFFKHFNDQYGHEAGDLVLRHMGEVLLERFRESDLVARYGGEEFCVLAVGTGREGALDVFENLRRTVENLCVEMGQSELPRVTVSVGLCVHETATLEEAINIADAMLYKAKRTGRNKVVLDQ